MRAGIILVAVGAATLAAPDSGWAQTSGNADTIVITGRLNAARQSIAPGLGATVYSVTDENIKALPGADNQQLNQVVLQLPGVVQDGFGQLHIRDDHNNIQYRLNGVILPEGISVFGQTLSPRLIGKLDLITGAMPAQYGLRTAGVIDITTKSGLFHNGGQVSLYGGSHGLIEPSFEYGGSSGNTNYFVSGSLERNDLGIESVDGSSTPIHDRTDQGNIFAYGEHIIDQSSRISLIGGYYNARFQIPDPPGLRPDGTYSLLGQTAFPSANLDQSQRETTAFAIASYLHDAGKLTTQTSLSARYSTLTYRPDVAGELLYNGVAQYAAKRDTAFGLQSEGAYRASDAHTIRAGLIVQDERGSSHTITNVFTGAPGAPTSDVPEAIVDDGGKTQWTESVYLQDEWKLQQSLTLNYGLRFDAYQGFRSENQLSPRVNFVWAATPTTTFHAGYSRYFSPAPFENVAAPTIAKFVGTTAAAPGTADTTPFAERQHYFDVGVQQKLGHFTLGIDAYDRKSRNLIDEGQFGAPIILTPFNYKDGKITGLELSANYDHGPLSAYANFSVAKAQGRDIVSSEFNFDPGDLATIQNQFIYLDHDQTYTASAGASYRFDTGTRIGGDLLYGSGLRKDGVVPNGASLADYVQVNLSASQKLVQNIEVRLDVINAFDKIYEIRDGSGIGVGAPQFGPRRGFFIGATRSF